MLAHIIAGEQNKAIAANLDISMKTVEVHRAHIMRKLAVSSVADLVTLYLAAERPTGKP